MSDLEPLRSSGPTRPKRSETGLVATLWVGLLGSTLLGGGVATFATSVFRTARGLPLREEEVPNAPLDAAFLWIGAGAATVLFFAGSVALLALARRGDRRAHILTGGLYWLFLVIHALEACGAPVHRVGPGGF